MLTATVLLVFYLLLVLWPQPTPSTLPAGAQAPTPDAQSNTSQQRTDSARADSVRRAARLDSLRADNERRAALGPDSLRADSIRRALLTPPGGNTTTVRGTTESDSSRQVAGAEKGKDESRSRTCKARLAEAWTRTDKPAPAACVRIFGRDFLLWDEQRLLMLVLLGGALGGLLHVLRSFGWYVGNRELVMSWLPRYVLLITTGAGLAFVFYVVVRGGFFSPGTSFENTSPFGFIAFATLVGLFSEQAILKLKEISETLLSKPQKGADPAMQGTTTTTSGGSGTTTTTAAPPTIAAIAPVQAAPGAAIRQFTVQGTGFVAQSEVLVNGAKVATTFVSATQLTFDPGTSPATGAVLKVTVRNPDAQEATTSYTVP